MLDATAMTGMITSIKAIAELSQLAINAHDAAATRAKVIELQGQIVAAQNAALLVQAQHSALLSRESELEKEVANLKAWDAEKEKYQLAKLTPHADVFAYVLKSHHGASEPTHHICANCYEDGVKSILQHETRTPLAEVLVCPRCSAEHYVSGKRYPEHNAAKRAPRRG